MVPCGTAAVVAGGDEGRLCRISADGHGEVLAAFGRGWVDCVAMPSGAGLAACSVGG